MFRYALRLQRWGILGWGAVIFVSGFLSGVSFPQIAGTTAQSRASFAEQMTIIAPQYAYLVPLPHDPGAVAGSAGSFLGAAGSEQLGIGNLAGEALVFWLLALDLYAICFLVAQLPASKRAAQALGALV